MTVFFTNNKIKKEIGTGESIQECHNIISQFLKERNYKSYYWRIAKYTDHEWIDVGSYTEFFEVWW